MAVVTLTAGNPIPLVLQPGNSLELVTSTGAVGTVAIPGEAVAQTLSASTAYGYGPFTAQRDVIVTLTQGTATADIASGYSPLTVAQASAGATGVAGVTAGGALVGPDGAAISASGGFPLESSVNLGTQALSSYLSTARTKKAGVVAGTGRMRILRVGDSTEWGAYGLGSGTSAAGNRPYCVGVRFANILNRSGLPAFAESWFGDGNVTGLASTVPAYDTRITFGTGWASNAAVAAGGGKTVSSTTASTALTFQPRTPCDTFVVFYIRQASSASFTLDRSGDTSVSVTNSGSNSMLSATLTGALGMAPLSITHDATVNALNICGIIAYNSTVPAIDVINMGAQSSKVLDWVVTSNAWSWRNQIAAIAPDLTIIAPGINDWNAATTIGDSATPGTFIGDLHLVVTTARLSGDVMISSSFPTINSTTSLTTQKNYVDALRSYCTAQGILFQDLWSKWGSQENNAAWYANTIHPNAAGYYERAHAEALIINAL